MSQSSYSGDMHVSHIHTRIELLISMLTDDELAAVARARAHYDEHGTPHDGVAYSTGGTDETTT